uniref:Uncharacterized protein n=1 Tax=Taeniopygia guttata TaxID=59729 RepID=A0A674HFC0_TAEGU
LETFALGEKGTKLTDDVAQIIAESLEGFLKGNAMALIQTGKWTTSSVLEQSFIEKTKLNSPIKYNITEVI